MLAKRFTIICFICMLFGVGLSIIVVETARPQNSWSASSQQNCTWSSGESCNRVKSASFF